MTRRAVPLVLAVVAIAIVAMLPPIHQDPSYHSFTDRRTILGIPNFWNVTSNLPFLVAALWGIGALQNKSAFQERWERTAYVVALLGAGRVAFGSAYYHWHPDDATRFWDRLPMTIVFMSVLAMTIGERVDAWAERLLLLPLLAAGVLSVLVWRWTGDLRLYALVQFYPMLALPLILLLFPPRYTGTAAYWGMIALYGVAKLLELADARIGQIIATGGHPWKHAAGAGAIACYFGMVRTRHS